jgi:hypothetical protein
VKYGTNKWLVVGGWLSIVAALLHVGCIVGGGDWYRFFGAGEEMARADEAGHWMPAIMTSGIALILAIWAAYAFSGAGLIRRLPLIRTALVIISGIYLLRGLFIIPILIEPAMRSPFNIWSSLIVLGYGIAYAIGTRLAWPQLSTPESHQTSRSL